MKEHIHCCLTAKLAKRFGNQWSYAFWFMCYNLTWFKVVNCVHVSIVFINEDSFTTIIVYHDGKVLCKYSSVISITMYLRESTTDTQMFDHYYYLSLNKCLRTNEQFKLLTRFLCTSALTIRHQYKCFAYNCQFVQSINRANIRQFQNRIPAHDSHIFMFTLSYSIIIASLLHPSKHRLAPRCTTYRPTVWCTLCIRLDTARWIGLVFLHRRRDRSAYIVVIRAEQL